MASIARLIAPTTAAALAAFSLLCLSGVSGVAAQTADQPPVPAAGEKAPVAAEPPVPADKAPAPVEPTPAASDSGASAGDNYNSPLRGQCMTELRKDQAWRAELEKELRVKVHQEETDLIAKNKKHVIMAYSALWIIMVVFVVFTWRKHRALKMEAERLNAEVERLADEDDA